MNAFGTASQMFPLVEVRCVRENRARFRRDSFAELQRANSYYSMSGRWPDVGWLLLDRASYNQLNPYATNLQLVIQDYLNPQLTIPNLTVVQARCVTRGLASDPNAIYLVQVTNNEGVLYNPWFQYPVNVQYNVRAPAYDGQYYANTLNAGNPWTWSQMIGDLWNKTTLLGAYPGLPITPVSTPENFIFTGVPLWEALNKLLDYLGLVISGQSTLTINVPGAADASFTALQNKYGSSTSPNYCLEDDMEWLDTGSGRVPNIVVVYFHCRYQIYGVEETVRRDNLQWQGLPPIYSVSINAPAQFASAAGTAYVWADYTVRLDMEGNPLAADAAMAQTVAAERASQFYTTLYRGSSGFMRQVYGGALPFTTGSLVDGVRWFQTAMLGNREDEYGGWRTEIIRGYIWEEATFPLTLQGLTGPT